MEKLVMQNLFGGIYKGKTVLITGHTGFKGSWLALWLNQMGANVVGTLKAYENKE
jgi:CDP-glucose 4,6-dehydratase